MIKYLKQGKQAEEKAIDNQKVKEIVESIISDIEKRGDEAVSQYSGQFDKWTPESFRLGREEIDACYEQLTEQEISDIKWAQEQVRNFATIQRESMKDVEVETLPGVVLGHKNITVFKSNCFNNQAPINSPDNKRKNVFDFISLILMIQKGMEATSWIPTF